MSNPKKERTPAQLAGDRARSAKMKQRHALGLMPKKTPTAYAGIDQCGNVVYFNYKNQKICQSQLHNYKLSDKQFAFTDKVPAKSRKNRTIPYPPPQPVRQFRRKPLISYPSISSIPPPLPPNAPVGSAMYLNSGSGLVGGGPALLSQAPLGRVVYSASAKPKRTVKRTRTVKRSVPVGTSRGGAVY